ncbi:MAG: DUF881 domain-containing protein [Peptococcia bacterium]
MNNKPKWYVPITIVFVFLGLLLSTQYHSKNTISGDLNMQTTENLIAMVSDLSEKRQRLNSEIIDLNGKLSLQRESYEDENKLAASMRAEIEELGIINGTVTVEGPGVTIMIDQYMPILYVDIIYIVNELWAAGAEVIAINDQRITAHSNIFYAESEDESTMFITVNDQKLQYPIMIKAIGNANNLEKGLTMPGGIMDNLALFRAYPVITKRESLTIPALEVPNIFIFMEEYVPPPPDTTNTNPAQG